MVFGRRWMSEVRWAAAVLGALAAEAAQVAAAFAWVAFYSHVIDPGQPLERYQDHAVTSGPWVSIVAGCRSSTWPPAGSHAAWRPQWLSSWSS